MKTILGLLTAVMLAAVPGSASILVTLNNPSQSGLPGDTLTFTGSIENNGDSEISLNADTLNFSGDLTNFTVIDNFFANVPFSIAAGETAFGIDLFEIRISPSFAAAFSAWPGSYELIGGIDFDAQDALGPVSFTVHVNEPQPTASDAPEPATWGLAAIALAFVLFRKRSRPARSAHRAQHPN